MEKLFHEWAQRRISHSYSDKFVNSTPYKKRKLTKKMFIFLVSFFFLYGVEFTYLSLNCFFRNTDAAQTSLPLVIFSLILKHGQLFTNKASSA